MITNGLTAGMAVVPRVSTGAAVPGPDGALQALSAVAPIAAPVAGGAGAAPQDTATARMMERLVQLQAALGERKEGGGARVALSRPAVLPEGARAEVMTSAVLARATEAMAQADRPRSADPAMQQRQPGAESLPFGAAFGVNEAAQRYAAAILAARNTPAEEARRRDRGRKPTPWDAPEFLPFDHDTDADHSEDQAPAVPEPPPEAYRLYGTSVEASPRGVSVRVAEVINLDPGTRPPGTQDHIRLEPGAEVLLQLDATLADWQVTRSGDRLTVHFAGGEVTFDGVCHAGAIGIGVGHTAPIVILKPPPELDRDF